MQPSRGVDAGTGRIVASALATNDVDGRAQAGRLLNQATGSVASFAGGASLPRTDQHAGQ